MSYILRDDFIRQLWLQGFEFSLEGPRGTIFRRAAFNLTVPRAERIELRWAVAEVQRCNRRRKARTRVSKARPTSPCCSAESRLRRIFGGVLTFACTACGKHWERRNAAPHLRVIGS